MNRRRLFAGLVSLGFTGCLGDGGATDAPLVSEGKDDVPIDRSPDELLPSGDNLDGGWEKESDGDQCREFSRFGDLGEYRLRTCAWVLSDSNEAGEEYDSRVNESRFDTGQLHDEAPEIGVVAVVVYGGTEIDVIFRDANVVGRVEYELHADGMIAEEDIPSPEDAIVHAVTMHRRWRE